MGSGELRLRTIGTHNPATQSRIDERRMAEVNVVVDVLNRMLELGCPSYVRIV
jgi:hypothetical protein